MAISLIRMIENEDGSVDCDLRMDEEGKMYLINLGFNALLKQAIENYKANEEK